MRIVVVCGACQLEEAGRRLYQPRRKRELAAELVHFLEIVGEGHARLRSDRVRQGFRDDVRIAVAIAADPRSRPQERRETRRWVGVGAAVQTLFQAQV